MLKSFKELLSILKEEPETEDGKPIPYEEAKVLARHNDSRQRARVVGQADTRPELLYYLAEDKDAQVRRKIAANPSTPRQADQLLATDVDDEVRCDLALKISRLIPGLSSTEKSAVQDLTFEILNTLAQNQLPRVRQIIAEEIKHATNVPIVLLRRLAIDLETIVSAPILEYSILLSGEDLLEIIAQGPAEGALAAIARRKNVSERLSDAIVDAERNLPAVGELLANPSAQIREETLDRIIEQAPEVEPGHEPLVQRPKLSPKAMRRIAGFVSSSLLNILVDRADIDAETAKVVKESVRKRIERGDLDPGLEARQRAEKLFEQGKLDDEQIQKAAQQGNREFVVTALALVTKQPERAIRRLLDSKTGKAVTTLAWKGKLSMRTAIEMQRHIARIPPHAIVNARNGVDFPLGGDEMDWYIDYFRDLDAVPAAR
ncbi:MAG: DUF2336 domain-containing protein [Alphaproteobacteria bacterium]|nr:DUF2336 domain-containing protein [Alphaproteobacteria bacterium]